MTHDEERVIHFGQVRIQMRHGFLWQREPMVGSRKENTGQVWANGRELLPR
jgi:hypothetical protein